MNCTAVLRRLSDELDAPGEVRDEEVAAHVTSCVGCAGFEHDVAALRGRLRVAPVAAPPPIADRVLDDLRREEARPASAPGSRRTWPQVAAVFVLACALGASAVGVATPPPAAALELRELVLAGQRRVEHLRAAIEVVEHGWHPTLPARTYAGELRYRAPETLWLRLDDTTTYPSAAWPANDLELGVDEDVAWRVLPPTCPAVAMPECLATPSVTEVRTGREPFDEVDPVPLDLVVPVDGFARDGRRPELGPASRAGLDAVGTVVPAAQLAGLLDVLGRTGAIRDVHPTDLAEVWLDAELGVPLGVTVRAADGLERRRWAASRGYTADVAGAVVLEWRVRSLDAVTPVTVPTPNGTDQRDGGFVDAPAGGSAAPVPVDLPAGMTRHRVGRHGDIDVVSWSDGRAWLRLRAHRAWEGDRLFGRTGAVRRVELPSVGTVYVAEGGDRVLVHGDGVDVELRGSVPTDELLRVVEGLPLTGTRVPSHWAEAATGTLGDARSALPTLLLPRVAEGFTGPGLRVGDGVVTAAWSGPGSRAFVLTQRVGDVLGPPLDDVVLGVDVRGTVARWTPARGELQWSERGLVVSLRSATLSLDELLALAASLERAPEPAS